GRRRGCERQGRPSRHGDHARRVSGCTAGVADGERREPEVGQRAERKAERQHVRVAAQLCDPEPAHERDRHEQADRLRRGLGGDEGGDVAPDHKRTPTRSFFGVRAAAACSFASSTGIIMTIPVMSQNGSMIRTMMNVFEPNAWASRPAKPARKPSSRPRSSGSRRVRWTSRACRHTAHASHKKAAKPATPVSASTRAYCASMKPNPVTPQPKNGRCAKPSIAALKDKSRADVDGSKATLPSRTVSEPFSSWNV